MAIESELKLRISPGQIARLRRHPLLRPKSAGRSATRRLVNVYYDTPKWELYKSRKALRLRQVGNQWLQTLKNGGLVQAGLHQRNEWEVPVQGSELDFSATEIWESLLPPSLQKRLKPVFVTDFVRTSRIVNFRGAQIELCIDQGQIRTDRRSAPICELELEIKSGEPRKLFELAMEMLEAVPFELESVSKAELGYRLLGDFREHPVKGVAPVISKGDKLRDVLKALIWSCLQHFQDNLSGATGHSGDPRDQAEYVHQMRVALRRLRVPLRMAGKICEDPWLAELNKDVATLSTRLGRIREWDVFIDETVRPVCVRVPKHAGLRALLGASEVQREAAYAELREKQQQIELQRLLLRFAIWMNGSAWESACWKRAGGREKVEDFVARRLESLLQKLCASWQHLKLDDAPKLHALRIVAKKFRYTAEFFTALYDKDKVKLYLAELTKVQDILGRINDMTVANRLLDGLGSDVSLRGRQEAVALVRNQLARDFSAQFALLQKSFRSFSKQQSFWRK